MKKNRSETEAGFLCTPGAYQSAADYEAKASTVLPAPPTQQHQGRSSSSTMKKNRSETEAGFLCTPGAYESAADYEAKASVHGKPETASGRPLPAEPSTDLWDARNRSDWAGDPDHARYADCDRYPGGAKANNAEDGGQRIRPGVRPDDTCRLCGRPIRSARSYTVREVSGGGWLALWADGGKWDDHPGDLGCWLVGSGCAQKIPAAYKTRYRPGSLIWSWRLMWLPTTSSSKAKSAW